MQELKEEPISTFKDTISEMEKTLYWLSGAKKEINGKEMEEFIGLILQAMQRSIFLAGTGRSELIARAFAMRLMHLGFRVYVIGDATTPRMEKDDLLIVISGTGNSKQKITKTAVKSGVTVCAVTSYKDSPVGKLAKYLLILPEGDKSPDYKQRRAAGLPVAPLNSLFEILAFVVLEAVIFHMAYAMGKTEKDLEQKHAFSDS